MSRGAIETAKSRIEVYGAASRTGTFLLRLREAWHLWQEVKQCGACGRGPVFSRTRTRTRTNTNPNDTEASAAGRSGNARALRKQSKCGVYHEGEGHWPKFSQKKIGPLGGAQRKKNRGLRKNCQKSEAFVGSAHSAETVKRKARERSS